jgi:hypothetical protein
VDAVRTIGGADCPQLSWMPTPAAPMLRLFGPEELGGFGDLKGKIDAEAALSGKPAEEIGMNVRGQETLDIDTRLMQARHRFIARSQARSCASLGCQMRMTTNLFRRRCVTRHLILNISSNALHLSRIYWT